MPQFITLLLSLTLLLLVAIETPVHASKKVEIKRVDISAEMLRDGSMKIVEKRTLHFHGNSSGATIYFYTAGGIGYSDILVRDIAVDYNKVTSMPTTVQGTYSTRHYRDKVVIGL